MRFWAEAYLYEAKRTAGLFPFNQERVLHDMPKPAVEHSSSANVAAMSTQNKVPLTPVTPVTPVTAEALTSLHNLIKEDACAAASDEACRKFLQMRVQNRCRRNMLC
jgi:hypothetical protein